MTSEKTADKIRYQTYEEFRKRFYRSEADVKPEHSGKGDGPASFGRRIVRPKVSPK